MTRCCLTTARELEPGPFWKVLQEDMIHNGFQYVVGENVDTAPWTPSGTCSRGGLYFTDTYNVFRHLSWGTKIGQVTLDPDEPVWVEKDHDRVKYKAHTLHLGDVKAVKEWSMWEDSGVCLATVRQNAWTLQFVKNQTPEMCLAAVDRHGRALMYVKNQTLEICLAAVNQDGRALECIHCQTPEICLAAVRQNGSALKCVHDQTPDICLAAVSQDAWALQFVKEQTPEICLAAVRQNGSALKCVHDQTPEICWAAVSQDGCALRLVKNQTPDICLAAVRQNGWTLKFVQDNDTKTSIQEDIQKRRWRS